jgi:tRNA A-37 threonylcarbamoyl transferase component Bud32
MSEESAIFDSKEFSAEVNGCEGGFKLLKVTANACIYRVSKCGKYFLKKTTKDNSEPQLQRLRREYELSAGCSHPHIVHIFIYESDSTLGEGILMEYVEGRTLEEYLAEKPSRRERERLFDELLSAVAYLHKRGIIHNDLKPENILVSSADNSLKLIDFGLANDDAHFALKSLGCTPRYASPELRAQSRLVNARSDIYSIGVIMQQMVGDSTISRRCQRENPESRYDNVEALQQAWRRRHLPYRVVAAAFCLLMIVLPTFLYTHKKVVEHKQVQKREILVAQMERDVVAICERIKVRMSQCPYVEFAGLGPIWMREECTAYMNRLYDSLDNADFEALLAVRFNKVFEKCWADAVYHTATLGLRSYHFETPPEQWAFYDSLVNHHLPYRPYELD